MTIISQARSFAALMAKVFRSKPVKKAKRYPVMISAPAGEIVAWNRKVAAGKISRKGYRVS
jgi:hypothetical protein